MDKHSQAKVALNMTHGMFKGMETQVSVLERRIVNKIVIFALLFLIFALKPTLFTSIAHAHPVVQSWENHSGSHEGLLLDPRISLYSSSQNFDSAGSAVPISVSGSTTSGSVTRTYFDLFGTYGLSEDIFIFARLSGLSSKVTSGVFPNGSASATGLSDQLLGGTYRIWKNTSGSSLSLQAEVSLPVYKNADAKAQGNPYLGDGSIDITAGAFHELALPIGHESEYFLETGAGFTKRSYGYSSAVPWSVLIKRDPVQGFYLAGGGRGQISLQSDGSSALTALSDQTHGAGGSYLINAINPAWILAEATAGYRIESGHLFYLKGAMPINGTNAPNGTQVSIGAQFDLGRPKDPYADNVAQSEPKPVQPQSKITRAGSFDHYDIESKVTSTHDQLYLLKIDKGSSDGVEEGQIFDIYTTTQDPITLKSKEKRVARAKVTSVKSDESALSVLEYFVESWVEVGFIAKRLLK